MNICPWTRMLRSNSNFGGGFTILKVSVMITRHRAQYLIHQLSCFCGKSFFSRAQPEWWILNQPSCLQGYCFLWSPHYVWSWGAHARWNCHSHRLFIKEWGRSSEYGREFNLHPSSVIFSSTIWFVQVEAACAEVPLPYKPIPATSGRVVCHRCLCVSSHALNSNLARLKLSCMCSTILLTCNKKWTIWASESRLYSRLHPFQFSESTWTWRCCNVAEQFLVVSRISEAGAGSNLPKFVQLQRRWSLVAKARSLLTSLYLPE